MAMTETYATAAKPPRAPNPIDSVMQAHEAIGRLVTRIEALADRLVGGRPENGGSSVSAVPEGLFAEIMDRADSMVTLTDRGMEQLSRIERSLP